MATFSQMTEEVSRKLAGFTLRQDRQTHLTSAIGVSDYTIPVGSAKNVSTGIIQIGDELIYIDGFDRNANTLTVPPYGRGYNGTTVSSHTTGSKVIISPTYPNIDIKNAINETIQAVFPDLYVTGTYTFTYSPARTTYALPDNVETVLGLSFETVGPTKEWVPIRDYRVDPMANTGSFNSRNSLSIYTNIPAGRTINVFYSAAPTIMQSNSDNFEIVTGLPLSAKDVITIGAQWRMVSTVDQGRLTYGSAESDQQSQVAGRAYGAGTNAAKYLLALYDKRLQEESRKLNDRNPIRIHRTR